MTLDNVVCATQYLEPWAEVLSPLAFSSVATEEVGTFEVKA